MIPRRVLGIHAGSAGLFSTLRDLEIFLERYLQDDFAVSDPNFSKGKKAAKLAWNKGQLAVTLATGTFSCIKGLSSHFLVQPDL